MQVSGCGILQRDRAGIKIAVGVIGAGAVVCQKYNYGIIRQPFIVNFLSTRPIF
jgi:hypothetical protein